MRRTADADICHFPETFGKEAAIYAGLKASEGDYVALMDVDLQDPPALLPEMYEILQEDGYDNVATKRATRTGEPRIRSFLSESFYKFVNAISKTEIVDGARDYRLMKRKDGAGGSGNERVQPFFQRESSDGLVFGQNGWSMTTSSARPERPSGPCGSCLNIRWRESPGFSVAPLSLASVVGVLILRAVLYHDCSDHCADAGLGGSGIRLAVPCLHYFHGQWCTASLHRNCRRVSVERPIWRQRNDRFLF